MEPSQRSLELAQVALQAAASACGTPFGGEAADLNSLAGEYQTAERELEALSIELYGE